MSGSDHSASAADLIPDRARTSTGDVIPDTADLTLHFPLNTVALKRGGLVRSVMRRANVLAASGSFAAVWIEVLAFQPQLESDVAKLKASGHLHERVQVRSVLYSLDPSPENQPGVTKTGQEPASVVDEGGAGIVAIPVRDKPLTVRFLRDGVLERSTTRNPEGAILFVDHYEAGRHRVTRDEHGPDGRVIRVLHYPSDHDEPTVARYIGRDGACFLTVWQEPGERAWSHVHLLSPEPRQLSEMGELYKYAFEQLLAGERSPVLFADFHENLANLPVSNLDDVVRSVRHPGLRTVAMVHSNHHAPPYTTDSGVSANWERLFSNLDHWDLLVLLTEGQRRDVQAHYGDGARMRVIPPSAQEAETPQVAVDPDRLVLVARTHPKKRVDEAVRVFRLVLDRRPTARLEIFGFGYGDSEASMVTQLVDELDLSKHVRFVAFASRQSDIYDGACVSLLTSVSEGFPLILLESMAHGCPVLAYDANFGPRDAIVDDVNGYLVPFGDQAALADRIVSVMESATLRERLGAGALASIHRFGQSEHLGLWRAALADLDGPPAVRSYLRADYEVQAARWADGDLELLVGVPVDAVSPHLVVRSRIGAQVQRVPVVKGRAIVALDAVAPGDVVDFWLTDDRDATEQRLTHRSPDVDQCPPYLIYPTVYGFFSIKHEKPFTPPPPPVGVLKVDWEADQLVVVIEAPLPGTDTQPGADTLLVVRHRVTGNEQHVPVHDGQARIRLEPSVRGDIFDFWLRTPDGPDGPDDHTDHRLALQEAPVSQHPPYRIYATTHGFLSAKHDAVPSPVGVRTASWETGHLNVDLDVPKSNTDTYLVARQRGTDKEQQVAVHDGQARIKLEHSARGDIFDFWLRIPDGPEEHHDHRLALHETRVTQHPPYRIYPTVNGFFSAKHLGPSAAPPPIGVLTAGWETGHLVLALDVPESFTGTLLLVRQRTKNSERQVAVHYGQARVKLDSSVRGDIFDFWLRIPDGPDGPLDHRLALEETEVSQHRPYQIYATTYGSFSVRHTASLAGRARSAIRNRLRRG